MRLPVLRGPRVTLRPVVPADRDRLAAILAEPTVARWWGSDPEATARDLVGRSDELVLAIELSGELVGSIQAREEPEPDYRHAAIDVFLTSARHGEGIGPEALFLLARHLFEDRGHHRITIDPSADNARAIRAYERVGFRPVGVMRAYERGRDGTWHDGLLMDVLAGELVNPCGAETRP